MKAIALGSCYLDSSDTFYQGLSALGETLRATGMQLIIFGPASDYSQYSGFQHVAIPPHFIDQGRLWQDYFIGNGLPASAASLAEMVALDRAFGVHFPDAEAELLTLRAMAFWERTFDILQPSIVLGWGSVVPAARLMVRIAQRRQTPAYIMERGILENTLGLSMSGQIALSSVTTSPALIRPLSFDAEKWKPIETYYRQLESRRYPGNNRKPDSQEQHFLESDPHPRVLFIGSGDVGSGIAFNDPALGERVRTWVGSSVTAAQHVSNVLQTIAPKASLWWKPHPLTPDELSGAHGSLTLRNIHDIDIHKLVEAADVCVTLASTSQTLSFTYDRPLITLANGFFMGRDIAYEVRTHDELQPQLAAALARKGWDERLAKGRALLIAMMDNDLFGLDDKVPTRLKMDDLALLLGRFSTYTKPNTLPSDDRIQAFLQFKTLAEGRRGEQSLHIQALESENASLVTQLQDVLQKIQGPMARIILERDRLAEEVRRLRTPP